jgi:phenylacetate-CoA ligase
MLIIRGVNVFPSQIEEQILRTPALAPHYQLELTREGYLDALTVHVESLGADDNASTRHKTASDLAGHLKTTIGIQVIVEVHSPGAIERSRGKARRLIDRRPVK